MLPKIEVPSYELELPLSKKKIKFRPFLVKEQKILLMAMEAKEAETVNVVVKDILDSCTLTEGIDIDKLPIIDVEYYFINLRAKSVGESIEARYRCNNEVEGKTCGNIMETNVDLTKIQPTNNELNPEIQLTDKIIVKMKYPEFGVVKDSFKYDNISDLTFNMIASSIEYIYDGEQYYYAKETQPGELVQWVEGLNQQQFSKIEEFYNNLPELKEKINIKCTKCGYEHELEVEGLENFFG
jgi:hypothetical protein